MGRKSSLVSIFTESLMTCGSPPSELLRSPGRPKRARLGPMRSCIIALHLRSAMVSTVAMIITNPRIRTRRFVAQAQGPEHDSPTQ